MELTPLRMAVGAWEVNTKRDLWFRLLCMKLFYQEHSLKSGIYKILNTHTNRIYIGQAQSFKKRWYQHSRSLKNAKHQNKFLQADFNKCREELGHDDFLEFHVLEVMEGSTKEDRGSKEEKWIERWFDNGIHCYNFTKKAISREGCPSKNPEETARKMRHHGLTNPGSKTTRFQKGHVPWSKGKPSHWEGRTHSEETKALISQQLAGRARSEETKHKLSQANLGKHSSPNTEFKKGNGKEKHPMFGKHHSVEAKLKISEAHKGNTYRVKTYEGFILLSPTGEVFTEITHLVEFARKQGLEPGNLRSVLSRKRLQHKGWKLIDA